MSKAVLKSDDNGVTATLGFKDRKGNVTVPKDKSRWSVSSDGVVEMTVAEDSQSARFVPKGIGLVTIDVVVDADPGEGERDIHATGEIEVIPAEVQTATLDFGAPD